MKQVSSNVYVESDVTVCNLGMITTKDGVVMIDTPGDAADAVKWRDEVSKRGRCATSSTRRSTPTTAWGAGSTAGCSSLQRRPGKSCRR